MQHLHQWLERKLSAPLYGLREPAKVTEEFRRCTGPRNLFGRLTLSALPAAEFSYQSYVVWPEGERASLYEDCVLDGILDVLMLEPSNPVLGVAVTLEAMEWHETDSCALAYGMAARQAMSAILGGEGGGSNYEMLRPPLT